MARKPILLGIHALKKGGKDTTFNFAREWAEWAGYTVAQRGFADEGKLEFARQYFPHMTRAEAVEFCNEFKNTGRVKITWGTGENHTSLDLDGREPIANLLTEGGRHLHGEDVWVDLLLPHGETPVGYPKWWESFEYHYQDGPYVADLCGVTDVRFRNEIERVGDLGGVKVKVVRDAATKAVWDEADSKGWNSPHDSELGLPNELFDFVLDNNGTLASLGQQVRTMMDVIQVRERELH